jgi:hypothetical protein
VAIKNSTTQVNETRTIGEIMGLLSAKGARSIQIEYDGGGQAHGISFMVLIHEVPIPFRMPCNFEGVKRCILSEYSPRNRGKFEDSPEVAKKARNIAWRNLKDWIAAQMAFIETEQATLQQVFMPYATTVDGVTAYDQFMLQITNQKGLPAASEVKRG